MNQRDILGPLRHLLVFNRYAAPFDGKPGEFQVLIKAWRTRLSRDLDPQKAEILGKGATEEAAAVSAMEQLIALVATDIDGMEMFCRQCGKSLVDYKRSLRS